MENKNKKLTGLKYSIKRKELKGLGYQFLENRRGYILEIQKWTYTIWIWLAGKTIYVNDWYDRSYDIIEFYKANRDAEEFFDKEYIQIYMNYVSGDIQLCTRFIELAEIMEKGDIKALYELVEKYKNYQDHREIYLYKDKMDKLIIELEKLKPTEVYAGTPVSTN